jgi:hypothetical protein
MIEYFEKRIALDTEFIFNFWWIYLIFFAAIMAGWIFDKRS